MSRLRTADLLQRITAGDYTAIKIKGSQSGLFYLVLEDRDGVWIHENDNGSMKVYPSADHALKWLRRTTKLTEIIVDIEIWMGDVKQGSVRKG